MAKRQHPQGPAAIRLARPPAAGPEPQIIALGYVEGALWRLVVHPPSPYADKQDPLPELQRQEAGHPHFDVVGRGDLLSRLVYQAWRRGQEREHGPSSPLLIP